MHPLELSTEFSITNFIFNQISIRTNMNYTHKNIALLRFINFMIVAYIANTWNDFWNLRSSFILTTTNVSFLTHSYLLRSVQSLTRSFLWFSLRVHAIVISYLQSFCPFWHNIDTKVTYDTLLHGKDHSMFPCFSYV